MSFLMPNQSAHKKILITLVSSLVLAAALLKGAYGLLVAELLFPLILVAFLPVCRRRENLWLFLLSVSCTIGLNRLTLCYVMETGLLDGYSSLFRAGLFVLLYCVLLSVEEIVYGILGRLIWRRQILLFPK